MKCCLSKSCTSTSGQSGLCKNNPGSTCSGSFVKNRCPGPSDVQCCVSQAPAPSSTPKPAPEPVTNLVVQFWLKSFIPLNVPDVTSPWPNHPGKTMLNGIPQALEWVPNFGGCFVTDQRSWSSLTTASARMHSEARILLSSQGTYDWTQTHRCGRTVKVDCDDGAEKDSATASTKDMGFSLRSGSSRKVVLDYSGKASDPLVSGAPKIDILGTLTVDWDRRSVEFNGKVDDFPAFEAYVVVNGKGPYALQKLGEKEGSTATSLLGGANRAFSGKILF